MAIEECFIGERDEAFGGIGVGIEESFSLACAEDNGVHCLRIWESFWIKRRIFSFGI